MTSRPRGKTLLSALTEAVIVEGNLVGVGERGALEGSVDVVALQQLQVVNRHLKNFGLFELGRSRLFKSLPKKVTSFEPELFFFCNFFRTCGTSRFSSSKELLILSLLRFSITPRLRFLAGLR